MNSGDSAEEIVCEEHKFSGRLVPVLLNYERKDISARRVEPSAPDGNPAEIKVKGYPMLKPNEQLRAKLLLLDA